jgi:hypothetical protein
MAGNPSSKTPFINLFSCFSQKNFTFDLVFSFLLLSYEIFSKD